ncbi:MAG: NUDIX hydrolase [Gammaproteobacteria bacterium]|nr:NUDIX hydrolase [Gammaproteobacteria bacterium]
MYTYRYPHPAVTVDVALFAGAPARRRLLLVKRAAPPFAGHWALPGGFVDIDEDLEDAARRELLEETGLAAGPLQQLGTWGTPGRDPRERVISVVYLGELPAAAVPDAGSDAAEAIWCATEALPALAFDHPEIVATALRVLGEQE